MSQVWLITGASRGLGRALTEAALVAGHRVLAAARNSEHLVGTRASTAPFSAVGLVFVRFDRVQVM
jgi:NAD(P)-dependent dehydrogenase (short-subunit alcohol dehydrogenase family)